MHTHIKRMSLAECKALLHGLELSDQQIEELRNSIYLLCLEVIYNRFSKL